MSKRLVISLIGAALLASGASSAHAQAAKGKATDFTVRSETMTTPQGTKSLLDTHRGRWGVTLNLNQRAERDMQLSDIQAGAYFRVTPSLRVGGAVAFGEQETPEYKKTQPVDAAPRVRLETAFKF